MDNKFNNKDKRVRKRILVNPEHKNAVKVSGSEPGGGNDFKRRENSYPFAPKGEHKSNRFGPGKFKPNRKPGMGAEQNPVLKHQIFQAGKEEGLKKSWNNGGSTTQLRLNKFISNSGVCSRREADVLITQGLIKVNGQTITELGHKISSTDDVEYKGKKLTEARHVYILLNKPKDTITTTSDPEKRITVMDLVKKATDQRIFPIGRLDRNTTGVLILTNDGDFAQKLSHPSSLVRKVYCAYLDKPLAQADFEKLLEGVDLEDGRMQADELAYVDPANDSIIGIQIHSGKNRIVHRMFESLGYRLKKLDRVVYAGLDKGGLKRGKWRFLRYDEVQTVLNSIK